MLEHRAGRAGPDIPWPTPSGRDVNDAAGALGLGAVGLQPPIPRPAASPQARALGAFKPVIVLDPGHGGDDTGAEKNGTVEKDVVLAFSLMLRDKLNATGRYKVLMTRDTDVFVELHKRREFAEQHMASLFVAVHADYAQSEGARRHHLLAARVGVERPAALGQGRRQPRTCCPASSSTRSRRWKAMSAPSARSWPISPGARSTGTRDRTGVFVNS